MNKALTNNSGPFNQIQVVFALAPTEFPFTVYTISLYNVNDMSPVSAVNVTKDVSVSNQHSSLIRKKSKTSIIMLITTLFLIKRLSRKFTILIITYMFAGKLYKTKCLLPVVLCRDCSFYSFQVTCSREFHLERIL